MDPIQELFEIVEAQIIDEAPHSINKGGIIKDGFNEELDDLRYVLKNSKDLLLDIQKMRPSTQVSII